MKPEQFKPGIERLARMTNAFDWNTDIDGREYFKVFHAWDVGRWESVVSKAIMSEKKMPPAARLLEIDKGENEIARVGAINSILGQDGCPRCIRGMRYNTVVENGQEYEKTTACQCPDGQKAQAHMRQMAKLKTRRNWAR